jgi:hypothetical protein
MPSVSGARHLLELSSQAVTQLTKAMRVVGGVLVAPERAHRGVPCDTFGGLTGEIEQEFPGLDVSTQSWPHLLTGAHDSWTPEAHDLDRGLVWLDGDKRRNGRGGRMPKALHRFGDCSGFVAIRGDFFVRRCLREDHRYAREMRNSVPVQKLLHQLRCVVRATQLNSRVLVEA